MTVLFEIWDVKTTAGIILTSLFWAVFAFCYQGLKAFRSYLNKSCSSGCTGILNKYLGPQGAGYGAIRQEQEGVRQTNWRLHLVQTSLQLVQTVTSYFLMLVVMTYNVWIFLAVLVGDAVGYLVFQWGSFDNSEHCN